jgi:hypothetical protein
MPNKLMRTVLAFGSSAVVTARLLVRHQLRLPPGNVGRRLTFADGTTSRVYRETVRHGAPTTHPTLLVVQFQLRLVRRSRLLHALFRAESIANTPLFAGFPGFRTKLWATDERTGIYRGVYEWDGAEQAHSYATTLTALLRLLSVKDSVRFHVEPGIHRDDFLRDPGVVGEIVSAEQGWWRLRDQVAA